MGYRGKLAERAQAQDLRAQGWTMQEIAEELRVSKSSVSLWTRHVAFTPRPRAGNRNRGARQRGPNKQQLRKAAQIFNCHLDARERLGRLTERDFLIAGVALYAGEGAKRDGDVRLVNSDPRMIAFFCAWLRRFFEVDESRLRVRLYLHAGLNLHAANQFWATVTGIPLSQFGKPYRAVPDAGIRNNKHVHGCASVSCSCSRTHRSIMGLVHALLDPSSQAHDGRLSGVAQEAGPLERRGDPWYPSYSFPG